MAGSKVTIKLTDDQQKQIKNATGKSLTELHIDLAQSGGLSQKDLDTIAGAGVVATKGGITAKGGIT